MRVPEWVSILHTEKCAPTVQYELAFQVYSQILFSAVFFGGCCVFVTYRFKMASHLILVTIMCCFAVGVLGLKSARPLMMFSKTIDDVLRMPPIINKLARDCGLHFGGVKATSYQIETSDRGITYFAKVDVKFPRDKAVLHKEIVIDVPTNPRAVAMIKKNPCT